MKRHPFVTKVAEFARQHELVAPDAKYLLALSGGADSVALLLAATQLGWDVEAVHCNFHLRGEESDRDEAFCQQLCHLHQVPFHRVHFDTKGYAEAHKVSIEMAARNLRYAYFENLRKDIGAEGVLVAHHRDDSVETVLINMVRGTGLHGLTGIAPRQQHILRPLLCVGREEILQFLQAVGQDFVTDSTNLVPDVTRNKIRLEVLPKLREINPSVDVSIDTMARWLRELAQWTDAMADQFITGKRLRQEVDGTEVYDIGILDNEYALHRLLSQWHFSSAQCEELVAHDRLRTGAVISSETHEMAVDRDCLVIQPKHPLPQPLSMPITGKYMLSEGRGDFMKIEKVSIGPDFILPRGKMCVAVDADKVRWPLTLRVPQQADRFVPFGMKGSKLLSDFLTDLKKTVFEKQKQWILTDANARIVWVVGLRIDDRMKITPHTTTALLIQFGTNC